MGIPWDGTGIYCYVMGRTYVPCTILAVPAAVTWNNIAWSVPPLHFGCLRR